MTSPPKPRLMLRPRQRWRQRHSQKTAVVAAAAVARGVAVESERPRKQTKRQLQRGRSDKRRTPNWPGTPLLMEQLGPGVGAHQVGRLEGIASLEGCLSLPGSGS